MLKQISLFLENKTGRLAQVCRAIAQDAINIRALSLAETKDFGILRMIVDDPDLAEDKLKARGFAVTITDVIGIKVPDQPGGLAGALEALEKEGVSVEYMYAFLGKSDDKAQVILRLTEIDRGIEAMKSQNLELLTPQEVYKVDS
jgi:hypothetical protein